MRQRVDDRLAQHRFGILGQRFAARAGNGLELPGVSGQEAQTAVDGLRQRTGALLARGGGSGAGSDPGATHELHRGSAHVPPRLGREKHQRSAQHARLQGWRRGNGNAEVGQRPLEGILRHCRPSIGRERLIDGVQVERQRIDDRERLVLTGPMFALANEPGHRVPAQRL